MTKPYRSARSTRRRRRAAAEPGGSRAVDADGVDQHLGLADQPLQVADADLAVGVVAVRNDHHRLLPVPAPFGQRHRVGHRVEQRGSSAGADAAEGAAHPVGVAGPVVDEPRLVVEPVEEELVVRPEQIEVEAVEGAAGGGHPPALHAAARVERDAEADRRPLAAEVGEGLQFAVLVDEEVVPVEARHETPAPVGHRRADVDQIDAGAEPERGPVGLLGGGPGGRRGSDGDQQRNQPDAGARACHEESSVKAGGCPAGRRSTCGTVASSRRKLIR